MTQQPRTPTTGGRAMLLPLLRDDALADDVRRAVEAIEADLRAQIEQAVAKLAYPPFDESGPETVGWNDAIAAVLAAIRAAAPVEPES